MLRTKRVIRSIGLLLALVLLFPVIAAAEGMAYREVPVKLTIQVDGAMQGPVDLAVTLQPGDAVRVELTAAGGTGYEWNLAADPKLLRLISKSDPEPLSPDKNLAGGPYRVAYTLQAGTELGSETVRFVLARSWEDKSLSAKTVTIAMNVNRLIGSK